MNSPINPGKRNFVLEVRDLRAGYGEIPILHGISLTVAPAESLGILGHNGMGKTTFLKTLIGSLPCTSGTVHAVGRSVTGTPPFVRARSGMAYVPQGREIFPALSVFDNLRMGLINTGDSSARAVDELLADFPRLKPLLRRLGGTLSGGEQQLLALARALGGKPTLLLLDEPTEGIQPSIIEEIADTLIQLRERLNLAIVLVEQNLDFIAAVSQRVLVIKRGRISDEIPFDRLGDLELMSQYTGVHTSDVAP